MRKAHRPSESPPRSPVQALACEARTFLVSGREDAARAAYDELVGVLQQRASRIAFHYLRDAAEVDEAVQDAFIRAYVSLASYKDHMPFDAWFLRILVNGCLDRLRSRRRRAQWLTPLDTGPASMRHEPSSPDISPEDALVSLEWQRTLGDAIGRLPDRQRTVVLLTHLDGRTPREVSAITGLNESTVRVHLFRAVRRLRGWLTPAVEDAREAEG